MFTTFPHLGSFRSITKFVVGFAVITVMMLHIQRSLLQQNDVTSRKEKRKTRVLWGIFSGDFTGEKVYRNKLRLMFSMVPDRICSLDQYLTNTTEFDHCELIYTFVAGALKEGPTERLEDCDNMVLAEPPSGKYVTPDFGSEDITLLNIK